MKIGKEKVKRLLSTLLICAVAGTLAPANGLAVAVYAEEAGTDQNVETTENTVAQIYVPDADDLPDNDELFAAYVMRTFYGESGIAALGEYGADRLTGNNLTIYNTLRSEIAKVASGNLTSTVFTIDASGMGITYDAANEVLSGIDTNLIIDTLLADCPYELYWYDKTKGCEPRFSYYSDGTVASLTFSFSVASAYVGSEDYTTDTAKTAAASVAASNAQAIVTENQNKSDYQKLVAYKDAICGLTSYNNNTVGVSCGDPWQLIYVFDKDTSTNVVCEGYSKAFQYLCDLSSFNDEVTCYTVTGTMDGGAGAGAHMWNIVTLDGGNYLADVTNSDAGTVGQNGGLFLVGNSSGSVNGGYTFVIGNQRVTFMYDQNETIPFYGSSILTLSGEDYTEPTLRIDSQPSDVAVTYGYTDCPTLTVVATAADGSSTITYQWYKDDTKIEGATSAAYAIPAGLNAGTYQYYCVVTYKGESYTSDSAIVEIKQIPCAHPHSETRGAKAETCLAAGYTGDTYCTDCGEKIEAGDTRDALGHNYTSKVTRDATTTAEGVRTYTCTRCGQIYTEAITKLPGKTKGESFTDTSSKAVYTVTTAGQTNGAVTYKKPSSSTATSLSVPATIKVDGVTYKVTAIASSAFKNNKKLTRVTIGKNVKTIGASAFSGAAKLKTVTFKSGSVLTTIGSKAFYKCTKLTKITIPAKVSKIGSQAFYSCKNLKTVTIKTTRLTSKKVGSKAFKGIKSNASVKVPKSKLTSYKKILKAKGVGSKVKIK